jgi:hypothetical protein
MLKQGFIFFGIFSSSTDKLISKYIWRLKNSANRLHKYVCGTWTYPFLCKRIIRMLLSWVPVIDLYLFSTKYGAHVKCDMFGAEIFFEKVIIYCIIIFFACLWVTLKKYFGFKFFKNLFNKFETNDKNYNFNSYIRIILLFIKFNLIMNFSHTRCHLCYNQMTTNTYTI